MNKNTLHNIYVIQVIQNRHNGSVDFHRGWLEYTNGFGSLLTEYWIGKHEERGFDLVIVLIFLYIFFNHYHNQNKIIEISKKYLQSVLILF